MSEYKYIITDRWGHNSPLLFSSEKKLLDHFQRLYPYAKNLRVMELNSLYNNSPIVCVLNHNTHFIVYEDRYTVTKVQED